MVQYRVRVRASRRGGQGVRVAERGKSARHGEPGISEIMVQRLIARIHANPLRLTFLRSVGKAPEQVGKIEFDVLLPKEWQTQATTQSNRPSGGEKLWRNRLALGAGPCA